MRVQPGEHQPPFRFQSPISLGQRHIRRIAAFQHMRHQQQIQRLIRPGRSIRLHFHIASHAHRLPIRPQSPIRHARLHHRARVQPGQRTGIKLLLALSRVAPRIGAAEPICQYFATHRLTFIHSTSPAHHTASLAIRQNLPRPCPWQAYKLSSNLMP